MDLSAFLDEFRAEASNYLRALDAQLLALEREPSAAEPIREMFIAAHTIKGGASMLGLDGIRELAHALEDVLAHLRDQLRPLDAPTADLLFRAIDALRAEVEQAGPGGAGPEPAVAELCATLRRRVGELSSDGATEDPSAPKPRALVVDESPSVRLAATIVLEELGCLVDELADGRQALERLLETPYRLVVAGVELPGLDGAELAARLGESPERERPAVILTDCDDEPRQRALADEAGAAAYIRIGSPRDPRLAEAARKLLPQTATLTEPGASPPSSAGRPTQPAIDRERSAPPTDVRR